ncbi:MAG: DUF459 domain-containing protein [Actinomycetota bacterium]
MSDDTHRSPLRAADPDNPTRTDTRPAGTVLAMIVAILAVSALLNADVMLARAETSELGTRRDIALAFWRPVADVGSSLGLTQPRAGLEAVRDLDPTGSPSTKLLATGPGQVQDGAIELAAPSDPAAEASTASEAGPADQGRDGANDGPDTDGDNPGTLGHLALDDPLGTADPPPAGPTATTVGGPPSPGAGVTGGAADDGDGDTTGTDGARPIGPTDPGAVGSGTLDEVLLRRPSTDDPLRVLIIGDSTLDPVGAALLRDLGETGVAAGVVDYRVSTGLSRPDFFDWPDHLRALEPTLQPEVTVVMLGANDAQAFAIDNRRVEFGSEEWLSVYRSRVATLLEQMTEDGKWVIWIGQPAMRNDGFDERMRVLNQVYASEVGRFPTARFVDSRVLTVDENGEYANYLLDAGGDRFQVRMTDGVHLTPAGGDRLAPSVMAVIDHIAPLEP